MEKRLKGFSFILFIFMLLMPISERTPLLAEEGIEGLSPEAQFKSFFTTLDSLTKAYSYCTEDLGGSGIFYGPWARVKSFFGLSEDCKKYFAIRKDAGEMLLEVALTARPEMTASERAKVKNLFPTMSHDRDLYTKKILFTLVSYRWFEDKNSSEYKIRENLEDVVEDIMEKYP